MDFEKENLMFKCPVCQGNLISIDVPRYALYRCDVCRGISQLVGDGQIFPLATMLARNELGDDRVRAAISETHVSSVRGFVETFETAASIARSETESAGGQMRSLCAKAENRLDYVISELTGLDLGISEMEGILAALREVREIVSPKNHRSHGVEEANNAASG